MNVADLAKIQSGQFKTGMERLGSTVEKAALLSTNPILASVNIKNAAEARERLRKGSLTLTKTNGKQVNSIGALAFFSSSDLNEFFVALLDLKPELHVESSSDN